MTRQRRRSGVSETLAVAVIQAVVTIIVSVMFTIDMIALGGCSACPGEAPATAQLLFLVPTLAMIGLTLVAAVLAYVTGRSLSWVPLIASVGTVVAYVVARNEIYGVF